VGDALSLSGAKVEVDVDRVRGSGALLLLDNCGRLLDEAASLVTDRGSNGPWRDVDDDDRNDDRLPGLRQPALAEGESYPEATSLNSATCWRSRGHLNLATRVPTAADSLARHLADLGGLTWKVRAGARGVCRTGLPPWSGQVCASC